LSENKTLITGATGFVGAYLIRFLLSKGAKNLRALKRPGSPLDLVSDISDQIEWIDGDLLDTPSLEEAMDGVDKVYHCAAIVSFSQKDAAKMARVNQEGTANVVNLALAAGIKKLVHVSSIAAIGRSKKETTIDEKNKWLADASNSPYGTSKHFAEMEVCRGIAEGLNTVIVNPSNILGSGFWRGRTSTGQLFYKVWNGMPFYPVGGTGFVDVRDVVRFMWLAMESGITNERFILNSENLPYREVFNRIANVLNVRAPHIKVTPFIREIAWRGSWLVSKFTGKSPLITKQTARYSARTYCYKNDKSVNAFDFAYTPISQTIKETGEQFLSSAANDFRAAVLPF